MTKTRHNNDVIDYIGVVYAENKTNLSWMIGLGAVCAYDHIRQCRDQSYRSRLRWNQN